MTPVAAGRPGLCLSAVLCTFLAWEESPARRNNLGKSPELGGCLECLGNVYRFRKAAITQELNVLQFRGLKSRRRCQQGWFLLKLGGFYLLCALFLLFRSRKPHIEHNCKYLPVQKWIGLKYKWETQFKKMFKHNSGPASPWTPGLCSGAALPGGLQIYLRPPS